jgi:hypothetical protein
MTAVLTTNKASDALRRTGGRLLFLTLRTLRYSTKDRDSEVTTKNYPFLKQLLIYPVAYNDKVQLVFDWNRGGPKPLSAGGRCVTGTKNRPSRDAGYIPRLHLLTKINFGYCAGSSRSHHAEDAKLSRLIAKPQNPARALIVAAASTSSSSVKGFFKSAARSMPGGSAKSEALKKAGCYGRPWTLMDSY